MSITDYPVEVPGLIPYLHNLSALPRSTIGLSVEKSVLLMKIDIYKL